MYVDTGIPFETDIRLTRLSFSFLRSQDVEIVGQLEIINNCQCDFEKINLFFDLKICHSLQLGSWSDRHRRRKPCMLIPLIGEMLSAVGLLLCVYFSNSTLVTTVFAEVIFPALTGM